ncbi:uncharacterized protein N7529_001441 [Penicillium soppii]|uniref:uncharacterized protein n=1 Tax=Penicillium soppii TaxID=69789 RepID=UPI002547F1E8|nr:uncharacterized protein N7529_001441 [Penicillium soppii]KAJ5875857.1 hypothetical protein N7529_001441 [Penicillium soppii]
MATMTLSCKPLTKSNESQVDFGAEVTGFDVETMTDEDFDFLRRTLYENQVVVLKNQGKLSPHAQYELTRRFDPSAGVYSHGKSIDKRSVLHADLTTIPSQPQVQVIGSGLNPISPEENHDYTHFYRWHIDSAMYNLDPPLVTTLLAVKVPQGRRQICRYDDGTDATLDVPLGTTAFFSGYRLYDMLSDEEQHFVRTSKAEYAPHPYIWMSKAKSRSNGLGIADKIKIYPMAWKNPVTGKFAMMVYPTCIRRIHLENGQVLDNLAEIRDRLYKLQRRAIDPCYLYTHDWQEGDLVLFNNHGVMHSIVGSFAEDEVRVFRQCNMAASRPPLGPEDVIASA